jgi:hypothetical protein
MEDIEQAASDARAEVDWDYIQEELNDVPPEYREQRFHALKHVVEIFSSGDPQGHTAEVSEAMCACVWL